MNTNTRLDSKLELNILKTEPCDLAAHNATYLNETSLVSAGTTISFSFDVYNTGEGDARGSWFDTLYLARFPTLSPLDIKLISHPRPVELAPGQKYTSTYELQLPISLKPGIYFVVFITDFLAVTNDPKRDNNQAYVQIEIEPQQVADLFVQNVSMSAAASSTIDFSWSFSADDEILNAHRCDLYYLVNSQPGNDQAADLNTKWSLSAIEIDNKYCETFSIRRVSSVVLDSISVNRKNLKVPMLVDGNYAGLVKTITNLAENDYDNNAAVSQQTVRVTVDELVLDQDLAAQIPFDSTRLFKFVAPIWMNSFRVTLSSESSSTFNDLFVGENIVPNENTHKARSQVPFSYNQTVSVRNVKPAVYYVLVKSFLSNVTSASSLRNYAITLRVQEIRPIDVAFVYPSQMSVIGSTTIRFTGLFLANRFNVK